MDTERETKRLLLCSRLPWLSVFLQLLPLR
jgi:hypothetical protein